MKTKAIMLAAAISAAPFAWAHDTSLNQATNFNPHNPNNDPAFSSAMTDQGPATATDYQFRHPGQPLTKAQERSAARFEPQMAEWSTYGASGTSSQSGSGTPVPDGADPQPERQMPVQPDYQAQPQMQQQLQPQSQLETQPAPETQPQPLPDAQPQGQGMQQQRY